MTVRLRDSGRTLHEIVRRRATEDPDQPAVTFLGDTSFTRVQLKSAVEEQAARLSGAGVQSGERMCLLLGNGPEFLVNLLSLASLGALTVPINTAYRGEALAGTLAQFAPCRIITTGEYAPELEECRRRGVELLECWYVDGRDWPLPAAAGEPMTQVQPWDVAAIPLTSGTTGLSKGVMWSHNMAVTFSEHTTRVMGYTSQDVIYTCLPMFHINALFCAVYAGLMTGAHVVVAEHFSASTYWRDIKESGATVTNMMGSIPAVLWRREPEDAEHEHSLRLGMVLPLPADRGAFERRFGFPTTEVYGSTDTGMPLGIPFGLSRPGACGLPTPGWEVALVDQDDDPVQPGAAGELVTRPTAPFIGQSGYWRLPELSLQSQRNLWFHTGDLLRQDDEGWYYYVGRKRDVLRVSGENVSSIAVEQALLTHPDVAEAAVFGIPSELGEDALSAAIVLRPGVAVTPCQIRDHVAADLPYFAVPRFVGILDGLPKTATEKVMKESLRESFAGDAYWDGGQPRRGRTSAQHAPTQRAVEP
jgi:crotonobetaine/carnitine-CoA ligase